MERPPSAYPTALDSGDHTTAAASWPPGVSLTPYIRTYRTPLRAGLHCINRIHFLYFLAARPAAQQAGATPPSAKSSVTRDAAPGDGRRARVLCLAKEDLGGLRR